MLHAAREAVLDALAVLVPVQCAGCGAEDRALCPACRIALVGAPVSRLVGGIQVVSSLRYEGSARQVVLAFKENGRTDVAGALASAFAAAVTAAVRLAPPGAPLELCPVPPSRAALRRRGYDPVATLLRRARLRPVAGVLRAHAAHAQQKALGREERGRNLSGTLVAARRLTGRRFLLIDDVVTTGATLGEVGRALREAGGEPVGAATLAFTPRRLPVQPAS